MQGYTEWGLESSQSDPQVYAHLVIVSPRSSETNDNKTLSWFGNCEITRFLIPTISTPRPEGMVGVPWVLVGPDLILHILLGE